MEAVQSQPALLRQDQVEEMEGEQEALERKVNNPSIQDKGAVFEQLRALKHQLETQRPKPYVGKELDAAVLRERELRETWTQGMLSHEEMRKSPPGAVDRHIEWERRNKRVITEWQNIRRRLNAGSEARDIASIELYRPKVSTMNLDGALIPGKQYYLPPANAAAPVTFSDEQLAVLRALDPGLADMMATLTNAQRAAVKNTLGQTKPAKRTMSPEHKAKLMAAAKSAREAKKAA